MNNNILQVKINLLINVKNYNVCYVQSGTRVLVNNYLSNV